MCLLKVLRFGLRLVVKMILLVVVSMFDDIGVIWLCVYVIFWKVVFIVWIWFIVLFLMLG